MCIRMNNIHQCEIELDEFVCSYYEDREEIFLDTFKHLREKLNTMMAITVNWVCSTIIIFLCVILINTKNKYLFVKLIGY